MFAWELKLSNSTIVMEMTKTNRNERLGEKKEASQPAVAVIKGNEL